MRYLQPASVLLLATLASAAAGLDTARVLLQTGGTPDLWQLLVGASPIYAPAIILGMLARRVLVFGWYYTEQRAAAAAALADCNQRHDDEVAELRRAHAEELERERARTARSDEARAQWERISWEWATTGQSAVNGAVAAREQGHEQGRLPPGGR